MNLYIFISYSSSCANSSPSFDDSYLPKSSDSRKFNEPMDFNIPVPHELRDFQMYALQNYKIDSYITSHIFKWSLFVLDVVGTPT